MANYPTSLPSTSPADHAAVLDELVAIATELGTVPSDLSSTVAARLRVAAGGFGTWLVGQSVPFVPATWSGYTSNAISSTVANSNDRLVAVPFVLPRTATFDSIQMFVTVSADAASGSEIRVAVYDDEDGPGSLVVDCGATLITSSGAKMITFGATQLVQGRPYWLVLFTSVSGATNPTLRAAGSGLALGAPRSSGGISSSWDGFSAAIADLAYPASAPASLSGTTWAGLSATRILALGFVQSVP